MAGGVGALRLGWRSCACSRSHPSVRGFLITATSLTTTPLVTNLPAHPSDGHARLPVGHDGFLLPHPQRDPRRLRARRRPVGLFYSLPPRILPGGLTVGTAAPRFGTPRLGCGTGGGWGEGTVPDTGACHAGILVMVRLHDGFLDCVRAVRGWDARRLLGLRHGALAPPHVALHRRSSHRGRPFPGCFVRARRWRKRAARRRFR
jgi:hypothetical protein